jgi:hypothetical protein
MSVKKDERKEIILDSNGKEVKPRKDVKRVL